MSSTTDSLNIPTFWLGTYTDGKSEGIYKFNLQKDGTIALIGLAVKSTNPSYLAYSNEGSEIFAVNEIHPEGTVEAFKIAGDSLQLLSKSLSGGADPCFIRVNKAGYVLVANYSSGTVGLLKQLPTGGLSALLNIQQHTGKGTTERQQAPHAHSAWFLNDGNTIVSADLGTNQLWFSHIDTLQNILVYDEPTQLNMAKASGPRHIAFHPLEKWFYVINELSSTITLVQKNTSDFFDTLSTVSTLPQDFKENNQCADIHITADGKFLYASNRGHNSIAIFSINQDNGQLSNLDFVSVHGDWPRNFSLSPNEDFLIVANQRSNNLVSFKRDKDTGLLTYSHELEAPSPVCILF
jgi:6-phosphogluconolactonase